MATKKKLDYDDEFVMEKRSYAGLIVLVIMIMLVLGLGYYYFAVIDSPKSYYLSMYDKLSSLYNEKVNNMSDRKLSYSLSGKYKMNDKEYTLLDDLSVSGIMNIKKDKDIYLNSTVNYKGKELIELNSLFTQKNDLYIKFIDIYDKVIKINSLDEIDYNREDASIIIKGMMDAFRYSLENANYEKKYSKIDEEYVKVSTLTVDGAFMQNMYGRLLQNNAFITSLANITGKKVADIIDGLNEVMADVLEKEDSIIKVYTSIISNKFIKAEFTVEELNVVLLKEDNTYTLECLENYNLEYSGKFKYNEVGNDKSVLIDMNFIYEKVSASIYVTYSDTNEMVEIDTSNYVLSTEISETDIQNIYTKIMNNEGFIDLLKAIDGTDKDTNSEETL